MNHQPRAAAKSAAPALAGKVALVTGAATGIGKAIAAAFAAAGANVVINHNHMPDLAGQVVASIEAAGGTAVPAAADVTSRAEYQAMVGQMLARFGRCVGGWIGKYHRTRHHLRLTRHYAKASRAAGAAT